MKRRKEKKKRRGLTQEGPEQIGSFKNNRWEIPEYSSRKQQVNGRAKVPAERSELIPLHCRSFQICPDSDCLPRLLPGWRKQTLHNARLHLDSYFRHRNKDFLLDNGWCEHATWDFMIALSKSLWKVLIFYRDVFNQSFINYERMS